MKKALCVIVSILMFVSLTPNCVFASGADTCKVDFETFGGSVVNTVYVTKGATLSEPETPEKEGLAFGGWYKDAEFNNYFFFNKDIVNSDITLYARWYIPFVISNWDKTNSLAGRGGMYCINDTMLGSGCVYFGLNEGENIMNFNASPSKGYIFTGWYKGVYKSSQSSQGAEPLDLNNPENLLSANKEFTLNVNKYTVIIAVFEECVNHEWSETSIKKATPTEDGAVTRTCNVCRKDDVVKVIPKANKYIVSPSSFIYNGKARTPYVTVKNSKGETLDKSCYKVTYSNNINAGYGIANVTLGSDYYEGTKKLTFRINKANNPLVIKTKTASVKYKKLKKKKQTVSLNKWATVTKAQGKLTYKKISGNKKITVNSSGKITVKKGLKKGTYKVKIRVTAAGNRNYKAVTKTVTAKIKVK